MKSNLINLKIDHIFLIGSALAFSLMSVCVKNLNNRIPVAEIVLVRSIISLMITRYLLFRKRIEPLGINKLLLISRGLLGCFALFCVFEGISHLKLSIATVIQFSYPTFISLFGLILLKESLGKRILSSVLLGWIGILIVVYPEINNNLDRVEVYPILIALLGSLLTALAYICVRVLSRTENTLVIVYYFPLVSIPLTLPFIYQSFIIPTGEEIFWLILVALLTQVGQMCITKGLKEVKVSIASTINYLQVIFASLLGLLLFKEKITSNIVLGSLIVLLSTLISISNNHRNKIKTI